MAAPSRRTRTSSISTIFFDLDNTLIKTRKGDKLACDKVATLLAEEHRVPLATATSISQTFLRNFRRCPDNVELSLDRWRTLLWADALGEQYAALAKDTYVRWLKLRYHYLALTPEVTSMLCKLRRNYLLALITNGPSAAQWEKVRRLDLQRHFDCILVSGDLPWEKPHSAIFHEACKFLGVEPSHCIMIGDKLETDILGGKEAGLGGTVWIPLSKERPILAEDDPCPDFTLDKVTDLPCLLPTAPKNKTIARAAGGFPSPFLCPQNRHLVTSPDLEDCNSNGSDGS